MKKIGIFKTYISEIKNVPKGYNISFEAGKLQEKYINLFKSLSL